MWRSLIIGLVCLIPTFGQGTVIVDFHDWDRYGEILTTQYRSLGIRFRHDAKYDGAYMPRPENSPLFQSPTGNDIAMNLADVTGLETDWPIAKFSMDVAADMYVPTGTPTLYITALNGSSLSPTLFTKITALGGMQTWETVSFEAPVGSEPMLLEMYMVSLKDGNLVERLGFAFNNLQFTFVPEPSTMTLLLLGATVISLKRRKLMHQNVVCNV